MNPSAKKYARTGIIAAIVIVVAVLGAFGLRALHKTGDATTISGASVAESVDAVSTNAMN